MKLLEFRAVVKQLDFFQNFFYIFVKISNKCVVFLGIFEASKNFQNFSNNFFKKSYLLKIFRISQHIFFLQDLS